MAEPQQPNVGFLARANKLALFFGISYAVVILALSQPFIQRHASYQHALRLPWGANFNIPESFGLAPGKTLPLNVRTHDNITLGSWFILSEPYYHSMRTQSSLPNAPSLEVVEDAIKSSPTVLYLHGAAGTRATNWRIQHYSTWTSRMRVNMFVIDYRGFGDSTGTPTEDGLASDAYAAWDWLMAHGARPEDVLVVGHSLGTGIASKLVARLARENVKPRGVALLAPFSSVTTLVETYDVLGFPILQPLQSFAWSRKLMTKLVVDAFDTLSIIQEFNVPTLIAHSRDDLDVPHSHSRTLLDRLLDPLLPPSVALPPGPGAAVTADMFKEYREALNKRQAARTALVKKVELPNLGTIEKFDGAYGRVVYVEALYGSHSRVGLQEGIQDIIAETFRLGTFI
ncbi:Alpha/Beta hydrolase protein [Amylocystis lapponica]|nr:Alpha/Beta hydrolase protein [Amylocystis lapponica]